MVPLYQAWQGCQALFGVLQENNTPMLQKYNKYYKSINF